MHKADPGWSRARASFKLRWRGAGWDHPERLLAWFFDPVPIPCPSPCHVVLQSARRRRSSLARYRWRQRRRRSTSFSANMERLKTQCSSRARTGEARALQWSFTNAGLRRSSPWTGRTGLKTLVAPSRWWCASLTHPGEVTVRWWASRPRSSLSDRCEDRGQCPRSLDARVPPALLRSEPWDPNLRTGARSTSM